MEEPRPDLQADADERAEPPDFDVLSSPAELVHGGRTRDDFFDAVLGLDSPATVSEVADLAGHGVDAAREYLEWFERLGVVTKVATSPVTYERNQAYLNWRRIQRLREQYTTDDLLDYLETEKENDEGYREQFGASAPNEVSIAVHAAKTDQSVEAVWEDVSSWQTTRRRISLLERALTSSSGDSAEERPIA